MNGIVLITCLENDFDRMLAAAFSREAFSVFTLGDRPLKGTACLGDDPGAAAAALEAKAGKLDFLLDTADSDDPMDCFTIRDGLDDALIERVYRGNVLRSMAVLEAFLPLLDRGEGKRLFYLTGAKASINESISKGNFAYNMSKAALHQFLQMSRNKLASQGYSFRVYDPMHGKVAPDASAEGAFRYIIRRRGTENHDPLRDDEENLVFRDALGRQHPW